MNKNLLDCDWCFEYYPFDDLYNVDYNDGFCNVLCPLCLSMAQEEMPNRIESVWK